MLNNILLKIAKSFLTKKRFKELANLLLDKAAEQIVDLTEDDIGEVTFDEAIIIMKERIKAIIDEEI